MSEQPEIYHSAPEPPPFRGEWQYGPVPLVVPPRPPVRERYGLHLLLFLLTFLTTTIVGAERVQNVALLAEGSRALQWHHLLAGLPYSLAFLGFLTCHEFGHYFAARWHGLRTSLPYYIPMYIPGFFNIGSFGAMIRLRQTPRTAQQFFDVGIAGPLAGFVVAVGLLVYGFLNLPGDIYLLQINPEYIDVFGGIPTETELKQWLQSQGGTAIYVGNSLLFEGLKQLLADPARVPNHFELLHYPYLFVGYITLFFTALNLLPVGQLDGGHILYGLLGRKRAGWVSRGVILALVTLGGIDLVGFSSEWSLLGMGLYAFYLYLVMSRVVSKDSPHRWLYILLLACGVLVLQALLAQVFPTFSGSTVWLIFGFLSARFFGPDHPSAAIEAPLSTGRKFLGWLALLIFILCFSPEPLGVYLPEPPMPMVLR